MFKEKPVTAKTIDHSLRVLFYYHDFKLSNVYLFGSELDFFAISKSGYSVEVEIKVTLSDFKNDFKKMIDSGKKKHDFLISKDTYKPNKYYFAVPEGLISPDEIPDEIPDEYGLIYCTCFSATIVKRAKYLHKEKHLTNPVFLRSLLDKFYFRYLKLDKVNKNAIKELRAKIN